MGRFSRNTDRKDRTAPGVIIREMELEDLQKVFALGRKLFTAERWPTLYRSWDQYELVELFASDGEFSLVAESNGRIVGFALGTLMEKYRSAWRYGWLLWLGISPKLKGRGIGSRLVNNLRDLFIESGARIMLVDTDAENHDALGFFRKQGFSNEIEHVYLSQNLATHPKYLERKAEQTRGKSGKRKGPATLAPGGTRRKARRIILR